MFEVYFVVGLNDWVLLSRGDIFGVRLWVVVVKIWMYNYGFWMILNVYVVLFCLIVRILKFYLWYEVSDRKWMI